MNFSPEYVVWILDKSPHTGKPKTATRRLVVNHKCDMDASVIKCIMDYDSNRKLWVVGNSYAICPGRGKAQVARFVLTAIEYDQVVADISPKEAAEEGFASPDAFIDAWRAIYGKGAEKRDAWVLKWDEAWRSVRCASCGRLSRDGVCKCCGVLGIRW